MELKQVKVWADPDIASSFKEACRATGVSMASELTKFMADRTGTLRNIRTKEESRTKDRRKRRKEVGLVIRMLESIYDAEEAYKDAIPANLMGGSAYDAAENTLESLEQAIDLLRDAYQ
jgi:hypothetical protein